MGRKLGQHFLVQPRMARKIVIRAELPYRAPVLEIGPGRGALTHWLLEAGHRVVAVEPDPALVEHLRHRFWDQPGVAIVHADILTVNWQTLIEEYLHESIAYLVSNIPYQISSPILHRMLEFEPVWEESVLMLQKEFADRLAARPGTSAYGSLSVLTQSRWLIESLFPVSPSNFRPPPGVWSQVVRFRKREFITEIVAAPLFREIVTKAFRHRRKTLVNNLRMSLSQEVLLEVRKWLKKNGWPETVRAQDIPPEAWLKLVAALPIPRGC